MSGFDLIIQPDEDEAEAAEVLVDGAIGGRNYRFLLDTGAAKSSVQYDDYTATFPAVEKNSSSGVFAGGEEDVIVAPSIEVGPIFRRGFALTRMAEPNPIRRNLIGMDLLKDFCLHFLFDENRVLVDPEGDAEASYPLQDLFLDKRHHPYIGLDFGGLKAKAVWDTGSSITVVDSNFVARHPELFQDAGHSTGTDSTGTEMQTPMYMMAASVIGGHQFAPQKVAAVDLAPVNATIEIPMDVIVGYNILSKAHWWMDFARRRWAISKMLG